MSDPAVTPAQRLVLIADYAQTAASGLYPAWGAALALDKLVSLLDEPSNWRGDNAGMVASAAGALRRLSLILPDHVGESISRQHIYLGLGSAVVLLEDAAPTCLNDRIAYIRILACKLSIILSEREIEARGHQLISEFRATIAQTLPNAPSLTLQ